MTTRTRNRLIATAVLLAAAVGLWFLSPDAVVGLVELGLCILVIAFYWTESSGR